MNKTSYFIIVYLNELHIWLKSGVKKVQMDHFICAIMKTEEDFIPSAEFCDKLTNASPDFEDDFEILIVEIPAEKLSNYEKNANPFIVPFEWISRIYPITTRGEKLLKGKIDDRIILSQPIFEKQFLRLLKIKEKDLCNRGAEALLKTFNFEEYIEKFSQKIDLISKGLNLREKNTEKISAENHFLTNLVLYDRYKSFPNNDVGFFYDIGFLLQVYGKNSKDNGKILLEFKDYLERLKKSAENRNIDTIIIELHNASMIERLEKIIDENIIVGAILFLYLRNKIRETSEPEKGGLFEIYNNEFLNLHYKDQLALAFGMIGFFFGFEMFADIYYKTIKPSVLTFPNALPEIKKPTIPEIPSKENNASELNNDKISEELSSNSSKIIESENLESQTKPFEKKEDETKEPSITESDHTITDKNIKDKKKSKYKETGHKVKTQSSLHKSKKNKPESTQNNEPELPLESG